MGTTDTDALTRATGEPDDGGDHGWEAAAAGEPHLGWVVAGCCAAAAVIHFAMVPVHAGSGLTDPLGFAVVGWLQLVAAAVIIAGRDNRRFYGAVAIGNLAVIALWVASRTAGLPFGSHPGISEPVAAIDLLATVLEGVAVAVSLRLVLLGDRPRVAKLAPALAAVAALGLATVVIASPDAASHSSTSTASVDANTALKAEIDAARCDKDFNIPAYWKETKTLGIDTYQGGAMVDAPAAGGAGESAAHGHGAAAAPSGGTTTTTAPDPTEGRGSFVLDQLVSDTSRASGGEGAAARLVVHLSEASDRDYNSWLWWLKSSGSLSHAHASDGSGDGSGHGGHVGPQPWVAMTDQTQCDRLSDELSTARKTALKYPTVADAKAAGWQQVTGYVPGIAAHFIKYDLIDGRFELEKPEMILYDGTDDDAHVVGLSYYLWHDGDSEPTQGFTGANDHGHRHVGLCQGKSGVIGDSTTTPEECAARGGVKDDGSKGWMSHAWVVPGCESPWGVFSAASPVLDRKLAAESKGPACAGSGVRKRYGLGAPPKASAQASAKARAKAAAKAKAEAKAGSETKTASESDQDRPASLRKDN